MIAVRHAERARFVGTRVSERRGPCVRVNSGKGLAELEGLEQLSAGKSKAVVDKLVGFMDSEAGVGMVS